MNGILIAISAQTTAGIGTLIGFGVVILVGLIAVIRFTILDLMDRREGSTMGKGRSNLPAGYGNDWVDAVRKAKLEGDTKRLAELDKSFPNV